jgi:hypothetical protein
MSKRDQNAVRFVLANFFQLREEGYRHKRVDEELSYAESKRRQASYAGKQSAKARATVERPLNQRSTIPDNQTTRQSETTNSNSNRETKPARDANSDMEDLKASKFQEFFFLYPNKLDEPGAKVEFWRLQPTDLDTVIGKVKEWTLSEQWRDGFIPKARTFLREGYWKTSAIKKERPVNDKPATSESRGEQRISAADETSKRIFGRPSGLVGALRADIPGRPDRRLGSGLPGDAPKRETGNPPQSVHASSKERTKIPPNSGPDS